MQVGDVANAGLNEVFAGMGPKTTAQDIVFDPSESKGMVSDEGVDSDGASSQQVVDPVAEEEARKKAQEKAEHEARMTVIRDYIETYGAPEEKEQDRVADTFLKRLQEQEDDKRKQGLPGNALQTWANIIQDPEDEGKVHVYAVKTDGEGKAKITRHMEFDSGDGEDRSQLTAERARARKAYEERMADGKAGDRHEDRKDEKIA
ncbi:hypothetical protein [Desulfovibrio ferrophilus]|uniref:Uncharacterized protein n=1 Tax=Desulfovibrio ferrophilus TaxID=241368 RepID=A0A2Z6B3C1_9BACT|nr:hypothetical protein [Desulfovibrio ferrophilus]BBD09910.1 uncharacterized protein DFE_3184 [Desulfovibrio ferrophilus]